MKLNELETKWLLKISQGLQEDPVEPVFETEAPAGVRLSRLRRGGLVELRNSYRDSTEKSQLVPDRQVLLTEKGLAVVSSTP